MGIKEIKNKEVWEEFLRGCDEKTFLDSWNWGEFQKLEGNKIWRFGIYNGEEFVAAALVIKIIAKRGTFLFVPHGPTIIQNLKIKNQNENSKFKILEILTKKLTEMTKKESCSFIRVASIWSRNEENIRVFKELGFREAPIHIHPEITWELDVTSPENELLMGMRKTTRYLIRQAEKNKDIEIIRSQNIEDIKIFNKIYQETASRHKFMPFSLKYLENEFSAFKDDNQISIFLGKYKNKVVSSAVIIFWQNMGFYHHGASLSEYNKIPVSYFLQWEAIKEAKKRGCQKYNFWGIVPEDKKNHPWSGLTLFKVGFGGYRKEYVKTQDLPLSSSYWLTFVFEKLRKIKRGL